MQKKIPFNSDWLFKPCFDERDRQAAPREEEFERVDLPHTNKMLPYNYMDERDYQFVSCYAKWFELPHSAAGQDVFLDFEGVMLVARVYCNGCFVCEHLGGYTPFSARLTGVVKPGQQNWVVVEVDSTERPDIPPFGKTVDYLTYGGIYREVQLRFADTTRLEQVRLFSPDCMAERKTLRAECKVLARQACEATLLLRLHHKNGSASETRQIVLLPQGASTWPLALEKLADIELWQPDNPTLYQVEVELQAAEQTDLEVLRFGFRECRFTAEGFLLNGRLVRLLGLNRHQSFPYVGYAMPKRVQRRDAELLKNEAGINLVRCSHYPQSRHFLDRCDELGLMVIEEITGWQHIGDESWKQNSLCELEELIQRDINRPSVILWGVRINESQDDHDFYTRTNRLAHALDPTRQTGGTRYIRHSELLEDVYTYNDFSYDGGELVFRPQRESTGLENQVPTLVTESMGHMFPVKQCDNESRLAEHALRHLRVIDETLGRADLAGGVSWCAFDYNSHGSFGSGDKVCYHGVYDMFRNPKYAAAAYASQKPPKEGLVLTPITRGARGERDGCGMVPFTVLTNCDFVRVYKNGALVGDFYPDGTGYPHLPHPPVTVSHLLEAALPFGFSDEDTQAYRAFVAKQCPDGNLLYMGETECAYLKGLAERYSLQFIGLFGATIRMAGGWGEAEIELVLEGWLDGQLVRRLVMSEGESSAGLRLLPDDTALTLSGDTYDATRVVVQAVDERGNPRPYSQDCVEITVEGPAQLMGPARLPLWGGCGAVWVRTIGQAGTVQLRAEGLYHQTECIIEVE